MTRTLNRASVAAVSRIIIEVNKYQKAPLHLRSIDEASIAIIIESRAKEALAAVEKCQNAALEVIAKELS